MVWTTYSINGVLDALRGKEGVVEVYCGGIEILSLPALLALEFFELLAVLAKEDVWWLRQMA